MPNLVLRKLETFVRLSDSDREMLEGHTDRVVTLDAREDFFTEGDDPRYVHVILEGWACRYRQLEDGRRQIVSFCVPGDMCDPMVFLLRDVSHTFSTITPVKAARLNHSQVNALLARSPTIAKAFWIDTVVSSEIQREWTVNVGRRTATERMAHLFCELPLRLKAVGLSDGRECELPLTQADLSDVLALSTVHVNRTLQELRSTGLVEWKGRRLIIKDEPGLHGLAMFDPSYLHLPRNGSLEEG